MKTNWGRFSLVDGMILIASSAIGMALPANSNGIAAPLIIWALSATLCSALIAGPLILASQWIRGRRAALSLGEYLWLSPFVLFLATYAIASILPGPGLTKVLFWLTGQVGLSLFAFYWLLADFDIKTPAVVCRWTDCLGSSVCLAVTPVLAIVIIDGLNKL